MLEVVTDTSRPPLETLAALPGVDDVQAFGERAHVRVSGSGAERAASIRSGLEQRGIQVTSVRPVAASLEDVFIDLITPKEAGTEVSPSMPTRRRSHCNGSCSLLDSGRIAARTASGRSGGANGSDAHPRGGDRQRTGEQPAPRGARGAVGGRRGKRGTARGGPSSCLVLERRLHAHQPRRTSSRSRSPGAASGHLSRLPDNYRSRLDVQWPIYTAGRVDALERAARAEREATGEDLAAARADLRLEITRAFWALVTATESERVVRRSLESIDAHVRDLRSRLEQGLIPPNDRSDGRGAAVAPTPACHRSANQRGVSEADLQRLLGTDSAARIEPAATLEPPAPASIGAADALVAQAQGATARAPRAGGSRWSRARAHRRCEGRGAALRSSSPAATTTRARTRASSRAPRYGRTRGTSSVNVTWALWDGGRSRAERAEAAATARAAEARVLDFDRQVAFEVRQRRLEVDSSRAAIAAAADGVRAALRRRAVSSASASAPASRPTPTCSTRRPPCCRRSSIRRARSRMPASPTRGLRARWDSKTPDWDQGSGRPGIQIGVRIEADALAADAATDGDIRIRHDPDSITMITPPPSRPAPDAPLRRLRRRRRRVVRRARAARSSASSAATAPASRPRSACCAACCGRRRGTALVGGIDVSSDPEGVKRRIGYMSQRFSLYELLTVDQNIRFFGGIYGLDADRLERAAPVRARDGRPARPRARRSRAISPAAGGSASRSAARSSTSRRSSFSTSRPAASIRCRAASSGG